MLKNIFCIRSLNTLKSSTFNIKNNASIYNIENKSFVDFKKMVTHTKKLRKRNNKIK